MANDLLKRLPGVDRIFELTKKDPFFEEIPQRIIMESIRQTIDELRHRILNNDESLNPSELTPESLFEDIRKRSKKKAAYNLTPVINATGIVVHTNLGRSLLAPSVLKHIVKIARHYSNLEYDIEKGKRGLRYSAIEDILITLTGAEAAMVVNNNAGAVLLCLDTLSKNKEAIVSRGELVEIGGAFRIPDVMEKSGAILKEVGCTNRTHLKDYEKAITPETALFLKVHKSNYDLVGFTAEVSLEDLVALGKKEQITVMEDLGSGTLVDFSQYQAFNEPTVQESIEKGVDIVTFSGDKLLGGPQAGIIVGKRYWIEKIRKNPLTRALRIDKLTLAALEGTLKLYLDEKKAVEAIPTLKMLTMDESLIEEKAKTLLMHLEELGSQKLHLSILERNGRAGGGALPLITLSSRCISATIEGLSANRIEASLRKHSPPIIGRIENDAFLMDLRCIRESEFSTIKAAFDNLLKTVDSKKTGR